jgi:hypothetical protein
MSYAIVKNNVVENIVEWDSKTEFNVDGELIEITSDTRIGGSWDGNVFSFDAVENVKTYGEKREAEYPPINDLIVALWEGVVEERMASIMELEVQRQAVKTKYPK